MIKQKNISLDENNKEEAIVNMFDKGSLYCIYGSAGTGKSTLISKELSIMENVKVLCLCNTHSALENLKNRINNRNFYFSTISSYLSRLNKEVENWDILVIDECSNVPTRDMADLLKRISVKLILLAGDIFQLPSIEFGNWYALIRAFLDKHSFIDLDYTFRTNNEMLLRVWKDVRLIKSTIASRLTSYRISKRISSEIFNVDDEDEVILCLNYDGLYGINNINKLLQINNPNPVYTWRQYSFKVGDPILFNENNRFKGYIYNNLKGVIQNIKINENRSIVFEILVDTTFNTLIDYSLYGFKVLKNEENSKSLIEISVSNCSETDFDKDTNLNAIVPFQIAYAISIHKAQGLEFNSVKIVITNEIEERISHNVFYTAITRAKEKLSIYWSPESEKNIISSLKKHNINIDASILSQKLNLELKKQ
jgi:ATP-dependent exoDNAse (exonuclease V) alpha subunit